MKIASWNVNSIKARLEHVKRYLQESDLDILMIQELKGLDFPHEDFEALGYKTHAVTQKAYNGVAMISKYDLDVVHDALPDFDDDQARYIEVNANNLCVINIYLPNGNPVDSEKYPYKLQWMAALKNRLQTLCDDMIPFVIGGDFNIIPEDKDCHDPKAWKDDALFRLESRKAYRALLNLGLSDAFRLFDNAPERYSFWDYQAGAWDHNHGIRIDHFLLSPNMADRAQGCVIDPAPRGWTKPSDHTPIILAIELSS